MDNVNNTLDAIEALAEMLGFFYEKLLDNGFDNDEALTLCIAWLKKVA